MTIAARLLLFAILTLPLAWSLYAEPRLGREATSSEVLREFFRDRSMVTLLVAGWLLCRLTTLGFPELCWWKVDALVWGGILIGHVLWSR